MRDRLKRGLWGLCAVAIVVGAGIVAEAAWRYTTGSSSDYRIVSIKAGSETDAPPEPTMEQLLKEAYYEGYRAGKLAGLDETDPFS